MLSTTRALKGKQQRFVEHYLATLNATKAARLAGYGGNYGTLRAIGSENLAKPHIAQEIARRLSEDVVRPEEVAARLTRIARGTMAYFINDNGHIDLESDAARDNLDLVKHVQMRGYRVIGIELHDAFKAIEVLARIYERAGEKELLNDNDQSTDATSK